MMAGSTLRVVPLFSQLRENDLEQLARLLRTRDYRKNAVIVLSGQPAHALCVMLSGQAKVLTTAEDGRVVILSIVRNGDFFGEAALLDDEPHTATVVATEDSRLLMLQREDFHRCIQEMPRMVLGLLRALCARLRAADQTIGGLILLDVPGRVARLLLQLATRSAGAQILDPPTHETIAQMIGSTRETVSRTIRGLADRKLIDVARRRIAIRDRHALEIAAGWSRRSRIPEPEHDRRSEGNERGIRPPGDAARG